MKIDATDWIVIAGGIAAIMWVNWYFFFAGRSTGRAHGRDERRRGGES